VSAPSAPSGPSVERASLQRLRALLLEEGGLMASLAGPPAGIGDRDGVDGAGHSIQDHAGARDGAPSPAQLAAAGPRADRHRADYELLIETIYEGYLLHYGVPRVALPPDGDLALLAGDRLYALGLARLVAFGDVAAVAELADTITLSALAQGANAPELADAIWAAGARAVGWGSSDVHRRAKDLALAGSPTAIEAMRTSAAGLAAPP
jgi:hypothetical protein